MTHPAAHHPTLGIGIGLAAVAAVCLLLGRAIFRGASFLDDQWRTRPDLITIRKLIGGGFCLGSCAFTIGAIATLVEVL